MNDFKIGGIYTSNDRNNSWRNACIVFAKTNLYLQYYVISNIEGMNTKKLISIFQEQINNYDIFVSHFQLMSIDDFGQLIDGYIGQIDENIIEKLKKLSKNFFE